MSCCKCKYLSTAQYYLWLPMVFNDIVIVAKQNKISLLMQFLSIAIGDLLIDNERAECLYGKIKTV